MEVRDRSPLVLALQHPFVGMVSLALLVFFAGLGQGDVRVDGAVYAWVSRWIVISGDWLNLSYDHGQTPYFNKPPLQFWLMAISYKLFGAGTWSAKVITPIFGLLCVGMTYAVARFRYSPALAATAGIVLTLTYTFFRHASGVHLDPGVTFFALAALWCALAVERRGPDRLWLWLAMGAAIGLGGMIKSPVILLAPAVAVIAYAWLGRWDLVLNWRGAATLAVAAMIWVPWHLHQYLSHGDAFTHIYFGREIVGRFGEDDHGSRPIWFFATNLVTEYWPWLPLAAAGVYLFVKKARHQREATIRMLVVWVVIWFVAAHLADRKHDRYLVPWYPAASIAAAYALSRTRVWAGWRRWVLPNVAVVALVLLAVLEISNVQLHRLDSPAVRVAAASIRQQVLRSAERGLPPPVIHVSGLMEGTQCRLRFYTDAHVKSEDDRFDWSAIPRNDYVALPPDSPWHAQLPPVLPLAEDARITIYQVIEPESGSLFTP